MLCPALLGGGWMDGWRDGWIIWIHACSLALLEWRPAHCMYHVHLFCFRAGSPLVGGPFGGLRCIFPLSAWAEVATKRKPKRPRHHSHHMGVRLCPSRWCFSYSPDTCFRRKRGPALTAKKVYSLGPERPAIVRDGAHRSLGHTNRAILFQN